MPRKGLTKRRIIKAAIELIEKKGCSNFSMRELADTLEIKTASLYNHVKNIEEIYTEISYYAIALLRQVQLSAIEGKKADDAVFSLAVAYRMFAKEHPELYKLIMKLPTTKDILLERSGAHIVEPIMRVLSCYELSERQKFHWQRVLRSMMHGFISQEEAGFFNHLPIEANASYQIAIQCFLDGLHATIKETVGTNGKSDFNPRR